MEPTKNHKTYSNNIKDVTTQETVYHSLPNHAKTANINKATA